MTSCLVFTKCCSHCKAYLSLNYGLGLIMTGFPRRGLSGHDQTVPSETQATGAVPGALGVILRNVLSVSALCWERLVPLRGCGCALAPRGGPDFWGSRLCFKSIALKFTSYCITMGKRFYLPAWITTSPPNWSPCQSLFLVSLLPSNQKKAASGPLQTST